VYVQWCIKGVGGIGQNEADDVFHAGLVCNWWRNSGHIYAGDIAGKLTAAALDIHVNRYSEIDPSTQQPYSASTAFLSLTSGAVERRRVLATNVAYSAHSTALAFATNGGRDPGYLFYCWVAVGLNPAVEVESAAEEVRELNTYRSWSAYQLEGEVTAKVRVPSTQIELYERYEPDGSGGLVLKGLRRNSIFVDPSPVLNQRRWF